MDKTYIEQVTAAVHINDDSIEVPHSAYVQPFEQDMLLFRDADGEYFAAAWRGTLVIDEAPFEVH